MRLFIAIDLPEDIKEELRKLQREFIDLGNFSFVKDFHLSLKFLGEVEESKIEEIKECLKSVRLEKFDLNLDGIGVFPNEDYVKVVWVGCSNKEVFDLQKEIDEPLKGLFPKENEFVGHVTLGRVKSVTNKEKLKNKLKQNFSASFPVDKFKLIKSELTGKGAIYSVLAEFS